jgi:hypothetical protein
MELQPIQRTLAAMNYGLDAQCEEPKPISTARSYETVSIRRIDPQVANLYLPPYGLLAGQRVPGGAGRARAITKGNEEIASTGGMIFNFSSISYFRSAASNSTMSDVKESSFPSNVEHQLRASAKQRYQETEQAEYGVNSFRDTFPYRSQAKNIYQQASSRMTNAWFINTGE